MTKSICALAHKPGSTRDQFQTYYEENHAPLAISHFPFSGYARNHVTGTADFRWDTISEFWADDIQAAAALMAGPIGKIMAADEERFMNRPMIASAGAQEVILSQGDRASSDGSRTAILIQGIAGDDAARLSLLEWAGSFAHELPGISVDFTSGWTELAFPGEAVLWLPGWHDGLSAPPGLSAHILHVRYVETPASQLLGNRAACRPA